MTCIRPTDDVIRKLASVCSRLPPPREDYLEHDALRVSVLAVIDFRKLEITVLRAMKRFEETAVLAYGLHTLEDLDRFLAEHPDDLEAAQLLWAYKFWDRAAPLRELVRYFLDYKRDHGFSSDIEALRHWAQHADFHRDFEGKIKGLGIKAFSMALQRLGVQTAVPDSRIKNFLKAHLGMEPKDECAVQVLNAVADELRIPRTKLDNSIWEFDKQRPQPQEV